MVTETIENIVFSQKSKSDLIDETMGSLNGLLNATFSGNDFSNLKKEFPKNTHLEDLKIKLDNVVIYIESINKTGLSIEVILDILINQQNFELGTFSHIFNETGELIDEILVLN